MVLVADRHALDAADPGLQVARVVAQRAPERVRLDVRLGNVVETELVGEFQEGRVVRVVRGPDRVEPELLHLHEVRAHLVARHHPARVLVEVVTVDPADHHALPVDEQVEAR